MTTCLLNIRLYMTSIWWIVRRLQGYNVQKPIPGQHLCAIPTLGMLPSLCHKSGGPGTWGADCGSTRARPTVRRVRTRVSSSVSCDGRAISKSSAVYSKATATVATPAVSSYHRSTGVIPQLVWLYICLIALRQSRPLFVLIYVMFRQLSSVMLRLLTFCIVSQLVVCMIIYLRLCAWFRLLALLTVMKVRFDSAALLLLILLLCLRHHQNGTTGIMFLGCPCVCTSGKLWAQFLVNC